ncbi:MAG: hypothetical protein HQL49_01975 [Gammaproteobacteria bacterium]|nr:hypothetical protein [Gammaproteobacteria bacterium]
MSENEIADFNKNELWIIQKTLEERYRRTVETQFADSELRLDPHATTLTLCPAIFWSDGSANFVVTKVGESRFRCQFFYRVHQQFGTGIETYDDLAECMVSLLQVQADYAAKLNESVK